MSNPVFQADLNHEGLQVGKFYFWDETWSEAYGPYETLEIANAECANYARQLNSGCANGACED
jgi:hypothetical protein